MCQFVIEHQFWVLAIGFVGTALGLINVGPMLLLAKRKTAIQNATKRGRPKEQIDTLRAAYDDAANNITFKKIALSVFGTLCLLITAAAAFAQPLCNA
jgi:hypothetical protein